MSQEETSSLYNSFMSNKFNQSQLKRNPGDMDINVNALNQKKSELQFFEEEFLQQSYDFSKMINEKQIAEILLFVDNVDFNIFGLQEASNDNELFVLISYLFSTQDLYKSLNIPRDNFRNFSYLVQACYNPVTYHNKTHAADVCQTLYYFLSSGTLSEKCHLKDLEVAGTLLAAICHDLDHPGVNNTYLKNTSSSLAHRYNDRSVLESHHIACAFNIIHCQEDHNIFVNFPKGHYQEIRKMMIDLVLATDMQFHFETSSELDKRLNSHDFNPAEGDKDLLLRQSIHMADISNPSKTWKLCYRWTHMLFLEYFRQGDKERDLGLPITFLMDKETTNIAKAQSGFIGTLVQPSFESLSKVMECLDQNVNYMKRNVRHWKEMEEIEDLPDPHNVTSENNSTNPWSSQNLKTETIEAEINRISMQLKMKLSESQSNNPQS